MSMLSCRDAAITKEQLNDTEFNSIPFCDFVMSFVPSTRDEGLHKGAKGFKKHRTNNYSNNPLDFKLIQCLTG